MLDTILLVVSLALYCILLGLILALLRAASRPTPAPPPTTTPLWLGGRWDAATGPTSPGSQEPGTRAPSSSQSRGAPNWGVLGHVASCSLCQGSPATLRRLSLTLVQAAADLESPTSTSTSASVVTRSSAAQTLGGAKSSSSLAEAEYEDVSLEEGRAATPPPPGEWRSYERKGPGDVMNVFTLHEGWECRVTQMVPLTLEFRRQLQPASEPERDVFWMPAH